MPAPASAPNSARCPSARASAMPHTMVMAIETITISAVTTPRSAISPSDTRKPSSATAQRSTLLTQNFSPGVNSGRFVAGCSAIPISSAMTMTGSGKIFAISGARKNDGNATAMARRTPGTNGCSRMLRTEPGTSVMAFSCPSGQAGNGALEKAGTRAAATLVRTHRASSVGHSDPWRAGLRLSILAYPRTRVYSATGGIIRAFHAA